MTASELIKVLQGEIATYGDLPVVHWDGDDEVIYVEQGMGVYADISGETKEGEFFEIN